MTSVGDWSFQSTLTSGLASSQQDGGLQEGQYNIQVNLLDTSKCCFSPTGQNKLILTMVDPLYNYPRIKLLVGCCKEVSSELMLTWDGKFL